MLSAFALGGAPAWWAARGVTDPARAANDFAPVNQGQLKKIATEAINALDAGLPGGAGTVLLALRANLAQRNPAVNDYAPVNLGQIKATAKPIYDRLILGGLATGYPWANPANPADDFALANIGQLKALFAFSLPAAPPATQPVPAVQAAAAPPPAPAPPPSISNGDFSNVTQGSWNNAISSTEYKGGGFRWAYVAANGVPAWSALVGTKIEVWKTDAGEQFIELDGSLGNHGVKQQVKDAAPGTFLLTWKHLGRKRAAAGDNGYTVMAYTTNPDGSDRKDILTPPKSFPVTTQPADAISQTAWQQQMAAFTVKPEDLAPPAQPARTLWIAFDSNDNNTYGSLIDEVRLLPVDIAIDANRDGTIASGESASQAKPLRFWINNDSDSGSNDSEKEGSQPDSRSNVIENLRDLEDFQLMKLQVPEFIFEKVVNEEAKIGLKWKNVTAGSPGVKIYKVHPDISSAKDYVWNLNKAQTEADPIGLSSYANAYATVGGGTVSWLYKDALQNWTTNVQHPYLLFEGVSTGQGQLCLVFEINGIVVEGPGVWLKLMDVEQMFESAQGTVNGALATAGIYPNPPAYLSQQPPQPSVGFSRIYWPSRGQFEQDPDETNEAIIQVHGWNMTDPDRRTFSESFFKRLWWKGYKGRFATFAWPTYNSDDDTFGFIPAHYNKSEYVAWKFGPALKAYVNDISKGSKHVAAHSMGNVVMASALRSGLAVASYVAMEAALPAGCYDDATNNYAPFLTEEQIRPTPDAANPDMGYRQMMVGINGNFHNFYSANDFALKTGTTVIVAFTKRTNWEANQTEHKPNNLLRYSYTSVPPIPVVAKNRIGSYYVNDGRDVLDHHEIMSFIARPHSEALGARTATGFSGFNMANQSLRYPFGMDRTEHSGQYQRPIQKTHKFYNTLLQRMNVGFNYLTDSEVGDTSP